ncbi:MAG: hypothetical protein WCK35_22720 [Chloroflexota bacterium]
MDTNYLEALRYIELAREALLRGDKLGARQFAAQAAELAPELEEVWLLMASLAAPRASLEFLSKALEINPVSPLAQEAFARAMEHLRNDQEQKIVRTEAEAENAARQHSENARKRRIFLFVGILVGLICMIGAVWFFAGVR